MRILPDFAVAGVLLLLASQVHGQVVAEQESAPEAVATAPVATADADSDDANRRVCKYVVQTGSRMGRKICHSKAHWDEMERAARDKMREIDSQAIPVKSN